MKIWFPSKTVWKPDLGVPEKGNIPVGDAGGVVLPDEGIKKMTGAANCHKRTRAEPTLNIVA